MRGSKCQSTDLLPLRGKKKLFGPGHETEFWDLLGVLYKIFDDHPRHFHTRVPPPPPPREGSFSNDDGDGNGVITKTITLHVHAHYPFW